MTATLTKLMKTQWFANPHVLNHNFGFGLETGVANQSTHVPFCRYDEGLGTPSDLETNPENAAFVVSVENAIYPDSTVEQIFTSVRMSLTKAALETDKIHALRYCLMPVHMAFLEDYTAIDELTSEETQDVLHMQTESTDRQGYPLYNNVNMPVHVTGQNVLPLSTPGLTTDTQIEATAFTPAAFYNNIHYKTNANKTKSLVDGLKWFTLTKDRPFRQHRIKMHSSTKRANPYMHAGLIIHVPKADDLNQFAIPAETTNVTHLSCSVQTRYNEWNQDFNFKKI